jgi:hypothetical protein
MQALSYRKVIVFRWLSGLISQKDFKTTNKIKDISQKNTYLLI